MLGRLLVALAALLFVGAQPAQAWPAHGAPLPWTQAATSTYMMALSGTASTTQMTRKAHKTVSAVTSLRLVYPDYYVSPTKGEVAVGSLPVQAWIEYPSGTYTAVAFGGSTTPTFSNGGNNASDPTAVTIPANTQFWTWTYCASASCPRVGQSGEAVLKNSFGEGAKIASSAVPTTPSASQPSAGGDTAGLMPIAILAQTGAPGLCFFGDSRVYGQKDLTVSLDRGVYAPSLSGSYAYLNAGVAGDTEVAFLGSPGRRDLAQYCTVVADEFGTNDMYLNSGTAAGAGEWKRRAVWTFLGKRYITSTVEPNTTSTDAWATTANQTATAVDAIFTTYNGDMRGAGYVQQYFDVSDGLSSARDSGIWGATWTSDGLHMNLTGSAALVSSGVVAPSKVAALTPSTYVWTPTVQSNSATYSTAAPKFGTGNLSGGNLAVYGTYASTAPYTVEGWIKTTSTNTAQTAFGSAGNDSITMSAAGFGTAVINGTSLTGTITINDGAWHYIALTAEIGSQHFCVDGALSASASGAQGVVKASSNAFAVGGLGRPTIAGTTAQIVGSEDEVAIFNYSKWTANGNACPAAPTQAYTGTEPGLISVMHLDSASTVVMGPGA